MLRYAVLLGVLFHIHPVAAAPLIATATVQGQGGWAAIVPSFAGQVEVIADTLVSPGSVQTIGVPGTKIFQFDFSPANTGQTFFASSATPNFFAFAHAFTAPGRAYIAVEGSFDHGGFEGVSSNTAFLDANGAPVDLHGADITSLTIHIDNFEISIPGADWNHDGNWTDYSLDYTVTIAYVPEPSGIVLLLCGACAARGLRRRRALT